MEANKTFTTPEVKLHFLDYWRIIRIRKTVILAVFLLVSLTVAVVTYILPETFCSTVRIAIEKDVSDVAGLGYEPRQTGWDPYWIQTEFEKIQSKTILYQVITNLNLNRRWAEKFKEENELRTDVTYGLLKRMIDVRQSRNTSLIEIRVFSEDKYEAAEIANEIAKVYRDYRLAVRREMSARGIRKLEEEWDKQDKLVKEKQKEVDQLKAELGISDMDAAIGPGGHTIEPESLRKLEALRIEAQADCARMETFYQNLTNLTREELRKAVATASPDPQLVELLSKLHETKQRLASMEASYGPEHPDFKATQMLRDEVDKQIEDRLDGILTGLKAKVESERARVRLLEEQVNQFKTNEIDLAIKRRPYWQARRDLESLQVVRERLQWRIYQEKVDAELPKTGIVEVVDPAEPALRAVRPNKALNITLGIIFGLALGVGLAFFIEYLDTSVKTIDDVERTLQAPVLGVIPQNVGSLIEEGPESPHAEAYRVLRTNILFAQKDPKLNTLTAISGGAGEGKSTTLFNLAAVFAQNGQRVLLVDSDLRRPSLHKMFKVSNAIGLTNYLLKQNTLEEVIQTTPLPTLDFMPSGKLPSSSLGLLSSQQMKDLIRDLKRRYDFVFFDSPPIMGVSDASILASEVDMVLQVIQYRRYPQHMTIRAKQMVEKVGGNLLGIVLNNINMASDENYYYYSGYYYYSHSEDSDREEARESKRKSKSKSSTEQSDKVEIKSKY
jgi:capsular exopolysaccharide synthesis family protein